MDTNKMREMREAFERTNSRDHRRQPPKGNNYIDPMAQADWESFQKGWQASREVVVNPYPPTMSITWYDTPEQVHRAMWEEGAIANGMTYEQMMSESTCVGEDFAGNEHEVTHEQEMAGIRTQGCWAFVDTRVNMIHAWADPEADRELVLHMLAHEIGHVTGAEHPDPSQEEMRAEQFGRVAKMAASLMPAPEPDAWRMFNGEDGYEYTDCPETVESWRVHLGEKYAHWIEPMVLPSKAFGGKQP